MKYALYIDIVAPRNAVVALFDDPGNWGEWQKGFVSSEPLTEFSGQAGAKTKIVHRFGRRLTEMTETIESKNLPDDITCIYEADGVCWNRVVYRFTEIEEGKTRWEMESEFRCFGFLRIVSLFAPGMFKKATWADMKNFKEFAERRR